METKVIGCTSVERCSCTQFMLYTYVAGCLRAILNTFGQISKENTNRLDPREGICRPTVCCTSGENTFVRSIEEFKRELGSDLVLDFPKILQRKVQVGTSEENFFAILVDSDFVSRIYTPHHSGGVRYIGRNQIIDIEEVSGQNNIPINPNRIRMLKGNGWKRLLNEGFDIIGSMPR